MKLIKDWPEFQEKIKTLILKGNEIAEKEFATLRDTNLFDSEKNEIKEWVVECFNYLTESFDDKQNELANSFRLRQTPNYNFHGPQRNISQEIKNEFAELNSKTKKLDYYLRILGVSDAIIKPNEINLEIRKNYSTDEIIELLLDKLFDLYDNFHYPVDFIFEGNGITMARYGESRQIVTLLMDRNLLHSSGISLVDAQLTLEGKLYVEEKRKLKKSTYNGIGDSKEEVSDRIDELIDKLNKLGLGQEILFDELQELKDLHGQLNKTNWGQLLKGKLIDLGLSQVIDKDTIKYVYEFITKDVIRLT